MRRPSSTRISSFLEATAWLAATLTACLSSEAVDLGSNYDPRPVEPDSAAPSLPESGPAAPPDAPGVQDAEASDAFADAPGSDAPSPSGAPLCIPNPSFEPFLDGALGGPALMTDPPQWQACSTTTANPQSCTLPPTEGTSYLGLSIGLAPLLLNPASVDATLCMALEPGVTYSLAMELALDAPESDASPPGEPPALQVRASNKACDPQADLLARFSPGANTCGWKPLCATFVPEQAYTHLILIPEATSSTGLVFSQTNVLVDDLRSGGSCPGR
jgi:hypothetical protein